MEGILIDFEGIDGSGKRTQSIFLEKELSRRDIRSHVYSYPDYESVYGKRIKQFLGGNINLSVEEQFLLYLLDMIKDEAEVKQELKKGVNVIMDRYFFSTIAYQCANHFDCEAAKEVVRLMGLTVPSIVFYLDVPVNVAFHRKIEQKGSSDRFEKDLKFLEDVKKIYDMLVGEYIHSTKWVRLNGLDKQEIIREIVFSNVHELIKEKEVNLG
jgi:dTMP kinase